MQSLERKRTATNATNTTNASSVEGVISNMKRASTAPSASMKAMLNNVSSETSSESVSPEPYDRGSRATSVARRSYAPSFIPINPSPLANVVDTTKRTSDAPSELVDSAVCTEPVSKDYKDDIVVNFGDENRGKSTPLKVETDDLTSKLEKLRAQSLAPSAPEFVEIQTKTESIESDGFVTA